jgi:4-amino-4-deoxy-L-arabinose transferase-like glycosyltransferase
MIKKPTKKLVQNQEWVIAVALSLLVTLLRLPSLEQPFDNDSGAIAYHSRLIVRGEPLYGTHHPAHHMPAVYYAYALAFLLFGDSVWAVKFLLILWTIVTAYLLYRLGALMTDKATGALAAAFYSILTSHIYMWGTTAEIELFANLPHIATLLVLMCLMTRHTAAWKFVFAGLLSAFTFLFKAVYFSPLAMAGLVLLIELWQTRATADAWRATLVRGLWLGVGFIAGLLPVVTYFGILGLLPRLLLVFTLGLGYVNHSAALVCLQDRLLFPLFGLAINNAVLLIFSLAGLLMVALNKLQEYHSERHERPTTLFYVAVWYILSYIEASIARIPFLHYYLLIVPLFRPWPCWQPGFCSRFITMLKKSEQPIALLRL